jgi:UDP-N-acetyl-alpha-D-muramoyl-L-alanyl-L-glutamate epimerase
LAAGVSYFKAAVPPQIVVNNQLLTTSTAFFFQTMYREGLREFFYRNSLNLEERICFPHNSVLKAAPPPALELPRRSLVAVGGGKDSIVTIELLKRSREPMVLASVGSTPAIRDVIEQSELPAILIERRLDSKLIDLNAEGAYNGHIPITAIISCVLAAAAVLYGFDTIIMSNEHSASSPNVYWGDKPVNHQFSKSIHFEDAFRRHIQNTIAPNLSYFSLLRPVSELAIAREFTRMECYHSCFSSCNRVSKSDAASSRRWCNDCPKCRFVYLILAPFLSKPGTNAIFGRNLLNELNQLEGFEELIGARRHKPFECVGEYSESRAALAMLAKKTHWRSEAVVHRLCEKYPALISEAEQLLDDIFKPRDEHRVPERLRGLIYAD